MIFSVESIRRFLASLKASSRRRKAARKRQPTTLQIENLEPRHLMAVDQTVDDAQVAFSLVGDWTTVSDSSSVGTAYRQFAGGAESTGSATWTFSDLEVGKHYEFLTTWADDATGSAAYSILDGGAVDATKSLDQSKDVLPAAAGETGWRSLGVVTADHTELSVKLTASSGITADAVRIVEVTGGLIRELDAGERDVATVVRPDGSYVVVWEAFGDEDWGASGGTYSHDTSGSTGIVAQVVSAGGVKLSPAFLVNQYTDYGQINPAVDVATDGSFVIAWQSNQGTGGGEGSGGASGTPEWHVYARRFDAFGSARGDEFEVSESDGRTVSLAIGADGGFLVAGAVEYYNDTGAWRMAAGVADGSGLGWGAGSSWYSSGPLPETFPGPSADARAVFASRYDALGGALGTQMLAYQQNGADDPDVVALAGGSYAVVWSASNSFEEWGTHYTWFTTIDAAGNAAPEQVVQFGGISYSTQPVVGVGADGGFVLVWNDASGMTVRGSSSLGTPIGPGTTIPIAGGALGDFSVVATKTGDFLVMRQTADAEGKGEIFAQLFDASGAAIEREYRVGPVGADERVEPYLGRTAAGEVLLLWNSLSTDPDLRGVHATSSVRANTAPLTSGLANVTSNEDAVATVDLFSAFEDAENLDPGLAFSVVGNSNPAIAPSLTIRAADGKLELHSAADRFGTASITVRATDKQGLYVDSQFQWTIVAQPDAPTIVVLPANPTPGAPTALNLTVSLADADGSETLGDVTISGVPTGATLSAGTDLGGGQWKVAPTALAGLVFTLPENATTPFRLTIAAGSTESSTGATATTTLQTRLISPAGFRAEVDDASAAFETVGDWAADADGGALGGGRRVFAGGVEDSGSARWTFSGLEAGRRYELFVSWSGGGAADAVYEVFDGGTSTGVVHGDQTTAAGDYVADGVQWKSLGVYLAASTELVVELNAEGASGVVADAARARALAPTVVKEFASVGAPYVAATAVRADGSVVVVWETTAAEPWTTGSGRYASVGVQVFDEYGNALTAAAPVYREGTLDQSRPSIAVREDGSFVIVWTSYIQPPSSGSGYGSGSGSGWGSGQLPYEYGNHAFGRLFNASGAAQGAVFDVGQTDGAGVDVAFRSDGGFVVVGQDFYWNGSGWMSYWGSGSGGSSSSGYSGWYGSPGLSMEVFAHWYGPTASDQWRQTIRAGAPTLASAVVAGTTGGWFAAAWVDGSGGTQFTGPGISQGTTGSANYSDGLDVAATTDGGWILARANAWEGLGVERFGGDGLPIGSPLAVAGVGAADPVVTSLDDGGFVVAWEASDGAGMGVFVQRFDSAGRAVAPAFRANASTAGDQRDPILGTTADGHVVVAWTTYSSNTAERGVYSLSFVGVGAEDEETETPEPIAPTATDGSLSLVEDQTDGVVDLNVLFSDADGSDAALTYSVVATGGLTFPTKTIDPLAGKVTIAAAADASGSGWIKVRATDADGLYAESKISVSVAAAADGPLLSVSPASGNEDAAIALSISAALSDTDGSESLQVVTISGAPTGAALSAGEFKDGVWKVSAGSLAGLTLTSPANFHGDFDLKITATSVEASNGDYETVEETLSVSIASVDDLTMLVAPPTLSALEDVSKAVFGLLLADVDAADGIYKITLSVEHGALSLSETSGLTFLEETASGGAELVFSGNFLAVNAALATLAYLGSANYSGEDAIHVEAIELGEEGEEDVDLGEADVAVTVAPVADAPVVTASSAGGDEDTAIAVTISADLADSSETLQDVLVTVSQPGATLSTGTSLGDGVWKLTSVQLSGLKVTPAANFNGSLELTVKAASAEAAGGGTASTSKTFSVAVAPVEDATTLSAPAALTASKNVSASVVGVHLADVDGTASGYQVAVSATHGALSLGTATGLTFTTGSAAGGAELVFHGTFAAVNAALATLSYKGATGYYGADAIAVHAEEFSGGSAVVGEASIAVTVVDVIYPPTLTVAPASGLEDSAVPLSITLATGYTSLCSIRIEGVPTGATLSAGTHEEDGSWTLTPALLTGLTLSLAANASGVFDLTVKAFDGSGAALVSTSKTLHMVVSAVNDAPTLSSFGLVESTGESGTLTASNGKVEGVVADVEGKGFFYVDLDLDADGKFDQTFSTAPGAFEVDLASLLKAGATTIKARASEYDVAMGNTIAGAWQTLTFTYAPVANAAPTTTDLALSGTPVETGNVVHAAPLLQGKLTDGALAGAAYFAELDLNGDDAADLMSLAKTDGSFSFNLNGLVDLGEQTVRVRGVEVDPQTFEYLYGEWASLKFTLAAEVNALPQISGLALVVDTDTADGVTSDPRITGTLSDPDSTGAGYYVEIDIGQDGTVDDTIQVKAGQAFTYDPTSRIAIGDVKLAVRGVEWKGNADPLRGEWSKIQFEYTGEPTSPPEVVGLALVRDTGTAGDGTSFDPRITGTVADATANGYLYALEVDFDGNGEYDDQITVQPGTSFVYDPASKASLGAHTYSFRGVERTTVNGVEEIATSDWVDFSFTRIAVPVVAPTLTNLHLVNDTDGAGDGLTTDARVAVEVGSTETDGSVYYQIEIDFDGDGFSEQTFEAKPGEVFVFDPANVSLMPGEYTLKMRSTATDYTTYDASGWEEVSFEYVVPVSFDPRVNALRLQNDTDWGTDRVTSDPRLTGFVVDGDRMGVSYALEVDVDGDGDAEYTQAATLGADFMVDPTSYIEYGKNSIGVRVVETLQGIGDDLAHASKVTLAPGAPYTIRAAIGDESIATDQDVFRIDLLAGQTLTLDVDAQSIGGLDSYLKIVDAAGVELASNGDELDEYGSTLGSDSKLSFTAAFDGAYYIVLSSDATWSTSTAGAYYLNLAVDSGSATTSSAALPSVTHRTSSWSTVEFTYTPPSAATLPRAAQTNEDSSLTFTGSSAVVVHAVPSGEASVTLAVAHGVLALGGDDSGLASLTGEGTGAMVLSGTIGAINAALASLTFTPDADYFGSANMSVAVQELNPASGSGEHRTSELAIDVRAINDAPTLSIPASLATTEDATVAFDASHRIVVADAESSTGTLSVTLRAEHGSLHVVAPSEGLSSLQGDGTSLLTLVGTAVELNASLQTLVFTPEQDYSGTASVKVVVGDRGNFGAGGPLSAEGIVSISVAGANDAPLIVAPTSKTVDKNHPLVLTNFTSISIQDVDAGTHPVSATLQVSHGVLRALGDLEDLELITGDGTPALTLVGTLAAVNAALASLRYNPTTDFVGWDAIAISVDDQGSDVPGATGTVGTDSVRIFVNDVWTAPTTVVNPPPAGPTAEEVQSQYNAAMLALVNAAAAAAAAAQGSLDGSLSEADSTRANALAAAVAELQTALTSAQNVATTSNTTALDTLMSSLQSRFDDWDEYLIGDFVWPDQPAAPTISNAPVDVPSPQASGPTFDPTTSLLYKALMIVEKGIQLQSQANLNVAYLKAESKAQDIRNEAFADADEAWSDAYEIVLDDYDDAMAEAGDILDGMADVHDQYDSQMNEASQTRNEAYHDAFETLSDERRDALFEYWDRVGGGWDGEEVIRATYDYGVTLAQSETKYTKAIADADDAYAREWIEARHDLYVGLGEVNDAWVAAISSALLQRTRDTAQIDRIRGESKAAADRSYDETIAAAAHVRDAGLVEAAATYARDDLMYQQAAFATWAEAAGPPGSDARNWADYQKNLATVQRVAALEVVEASRVVELGKVDAAKARSLADSASHETQQNAAAAAAADRDVARAEAADQETQDRLEAQATHREKNADAQSIRDRALASAALSYTKGVADELLDSRTKSAEASRELSTAQRRAQQQYDRDPDVVLLNQANDESSRTYTEKIATAARAYRNAALDKGATLDDAVFSAVSGYRDAVVENNAKRRKADVEAIGVHVVGSATADADYAVAIAASIHNENVARAAHERDEGNIATGLQLTYAGAAAQTASDAAVAAAEESQFYYDDVWDALVARLTPDPEAPPSPDAQYKLDLATAARDRVAVQGAALTKAATDAAAAQLVRDLAVSAAAALMTYSLTDDEYQRDVALSQATRDRASAKATAPLVAAGVGAGGGSSGEAAVKFMAAFAPEQWVDSWWTDYIDRWWERDAIYADMSRTMAEATRTEARTNSDAQYEYDVQSITYGELNQRSVEAHEAYLDTESEGFRERNARLAAFDLGEDAEGFREKGLRESGAATTRLAAATAVIAADRAWETATAQATLDYETEIAESQRVYSDAYTAAEDVVDRAQAGIAKTQANSFAAADSDAYLASEQADRTWTLTTWQQMENELGTSSSSSDAALREYQHAYAGAQVAWLIAKHQADSVYADAVALANLTLAQTNASAAYDLALVQIAAGTTRSYADAAASETSSVSDATATFERVRDDSTSTYNYRVGVATLKTTHETAVQKAEATLLAAQRYAQLNEALARIEAGKTLHDSDGGTAAHAAYDDAVEQAREQAEDDYRQAYKPYVAAVGAAYTAMIAGLGQKDVAWATEVATHQKKMIVDQNAAETIYSAALRSSASIERTTLAPAESTYTSTAATAQRDAVVALANARNVQMRAMSPRDSGDPSLAAEPRLPSEVAGDSPTMAFAEAVAEAEAEYHYEKSNATAQSNSVDLFKQVEASKDAKAFLSLLPEYKIYAGILAKADADFNRDEAAAEGKAAVAAANAARTQTLTQAAAGAVLASAGWTLDSVLAVANEAADHTLSETTAQKDVESVAATAQARADYATAIAKAQVKYNTAVAELQMAENQSGYSDSVAALDQGRDKALGEAAVEQAVRLGAAAVEWVAAAAQASTTQLTSLSTSMATRAVGSKTASLIYSTAVAAAEYTATRALGDAQATEWVELAQAAEKKDLAGRFADLAFQKEVATENTQRVAEIVAQAGEYAYAIAPGTDAANDLAAYNTFRVVLAEAWKQWAEEAETQGQDYAETAAGARTTYAQTMATEYRAMVDSEAAAVQTASVQMATKQAEEAVSLVQASADDLVRMAPFETTYRVGVAEAEKAYQKSMAEAALEPNRSTLETEAADARRETLECLRTLYAHDEQEAALAYAQAVASAQNTSAQGQANIQKTRADGAAAALKDFAQTQKTAATTRVETEADADLAAAKGRTTSWKDKTQALVGSTSSPFATYEASLAAAGKTKSDDVLTAASKKLKDSVEADQAAVLKKRNAELDFAKKSTEQETKWLVDAVQKATVKNVGQIEAMGAKTASGEYDPDLLFNTPNSPVAANAGQAVAALGSGGTPSLGWNPGTYLGYDGYLGWYDWYYVGPWNQGATTVSPNDGIASSYSGYYGSGYDGYLGDWDPWYGDGWYGDVASASSYGEFSYSSLGSLAADPGHVAVVSTTYGLPATATDNIASAAQPSVSDDQDWLANAPSFGLGSTMISLAATNSVGLVTDSSSGNRIAKPAMPAPSVSNSGDALAAEFGGILAQVVDIPGLTDSSANANATVRPSFDPEASTQDTIELDLGGNADSQAVEAIFRSRYHDDPAAIQTLDLVTQRLRFKIKVGNDLIWSKYFVDQFRGVIYISDTWYGTSRSLESKADLLYEALSEKFHKFFNLPETLELKSWRYGVSTLEVAGSYVGMAAGAAMTLAPEPVLTKVGGVGTIAFSINMKVRGMTGLMMRDGGLDLAKELAGHFGDRIGGKGWGAQAQTAVGIAELFLGLAGAAKYTQTGNVSLWQTQKLKEALKRDIEIAKALAFGGFAPRPGTLDAIRDLAGNDVAELAGTSASRFLEPVGDYTRTEEVMEQILKVTKSDPFLQRAERIKGVSDVLPKLEKRLEQYKGKVGEIIGGTGAWADEEKMLFGTIDAFSTREEKILHELGHVIHDLMSPGLFVRSRQAGFRWIEFFETEFIAYRFQYGTSYAGTATAWSISVFSATVQRAPVTSKAVIYSFVGWQGYRLYSVVYDMLRGNP